MRSWFAGVAVLLVAASARPESTEFFRYYRSVGAVASVQACATLDAAVYPHASPALKDLRLFARGDGGMTEVPYVLTLNEAQPVASETARVQAVMRRAGRLDFDLAMPQRAYTDVVLEMDGRDFIGTATVTGVARAGGAPVRLGDFTIFDLSSQRLARSTTLHLQEAEFPVLHVELRTRPAEGRSSGRGMIAPTLVKGATVPPSREAQTLYTVAASTAEMVESGRATVARFHLPPRVPVERVRVVLEEGFHQNFSREVRVTSHTIGESAAETEHVAGRIERTRMVRDGVELEDEVLSVPATLGANLQEEAEVEVALQNGGEAPLPVHAVLLEMRRRSICFAAVEGRPLELFYGDAGLGAPAYESTLGPLTQSHTVIVALGPEQRNPAQRQRPDTRAITERDPRMVALATMGLVCLLAVAAFRSGKVHHSHRR